MDNLVLAYLAGAMDSDGSFSIKKSTYHIRSHKDAVNPSYSEEVMLKQVTPEIPALLKEAFNGSVHLVKPGTVNSRPLYSWEASHVMAARACSLMLPYLRVKRRQAEIILELRRSREDRYRQYASWFATEHPDWPSMELLTIEEAAHMMSYRSPAMVSQAIRNGTLLATPYARGQSAQPRIPKRLVEELRINLSSDGRARMTPPPLLAWREHLCQQIRELNKMGVNGTPIYHRTGPYEPAG